MNYGDMRARFLSIVNRTDCTDTFAKTCFDQGIQICQQRLRLPHMERILVFNTADGAVSEVGVPADWVKTKALIIEPSDGCKGEIKYLDLGHFAFQSNRIHGATLYYTRKYDKWVFIDPIPQGAYAYAYYYGEESPLVNDADEPTIAKIAPSLLIYAALTFAADEFIDERGDGWKARFEEFVQSIQGQAEDGEESGSDTVEPVSYYEDGVY